MRLYLKTGIAWGCTNFVLQWLLNYVLTLVIPASLAGKSAPENFFDSGPGLISVIFFVLIFAPLYETLIAQLLPVEILRKCKLPPLMIGFVSAAIFGGGHYLNGNLQHGISTFFAGAVFACLYLRTRSQGVKSSYVVTALAHFANNATALLLMGLFGAGI